MVAELAGDVLRILLVEEQLDLLLFSQSVSGGDFLLDPPLHTSPRLLQLLLFLFQFPQLFAAALHVLFDFIDALVEFGNSLFVFFQILEQLVPLAFDLVQFPLQRFDALFYLRQVHLLILIGLHRRG